MARTRRPPAQQKRDKPRYDPHLEAGVKKMRDGKSLASTAREIGISSKRLLGYIKRMGIAERKGRRWAINDNRSRDVPIFARRYNRRLLISVPDYVASRLAGSYMSHVGWFLETNDPEKLAPFRGVAITDIKGKKYELETRPNALYRLAHAAPEPFEQVYRIVV